MRRLIVPGALIVLFGVLWGWERTALMRAEGEWDETSAAIRTDAERLGAGEFQRRQSHLYVRLEALASRPVIREALCGTPDGRAAAFAELTGGAEEGIGLELRGPDGGVVAWSGMGGPTPGLLVRSALEGAATSSVVKSPNGTQLVVAAAVPSDAGLGGALVGRILLSPAYQLRNSFLRSAGLAEEVSARAGTRIVYQFDDPTHDEGIALTGIDGALIGYVVASPPDRGATVESIREEFSTRRAVVLAAVLLGAGAWLVLTARRRLSRPAATATVVAVLIGLRAALLALGVPSDVTQSGVFDSALYASAFGGGVARSIGEFLITSVVAFAVLLLIGRLTPENLPEAVRRQPYPLRLAEAGLLGLFVMWGLRGVAAVVRSAVYDSVLGVSEPGPIMPSLPLAALIAALLITVLCFVMVALRTLEAMRQLAAVEGSGGEGAVIALALLAGAALFFDARPNPLLPSGLRWGIVVVLSLMAWWKFWRGSSFTRHATRTLVSAALLVPLLAYHTDGRERRTVETLAAQVLRPVDAWLTVVVDEGLSRLSDPGRIASLRAWDETRRLSAAFDAWASSIASREGYAAAFTVVDTAGRELSRFSIGGMNAALRSVEFELGSAPDRLIIARDAGSGPGAVAVYAGVTPLIGDEGVIEGFGRVLIAAGRQSLFRGGNPSFLRTAGGRDRAPEVVISEFRDGRLEALTEPIFPIGHRLPDTVRAKLVADPASGVWWEEEVAAGRFETWYVTKPGGDGVAGLSVPTGGSADLLLALVRVLIVAGSLIVLAGAGFVASRLLAGGRIQVSFRDRLLAALVVSALVPLVFMTVYGQQYALDRLRESTERALKEETASLAERISAEPAFSRRGALPSDDVTPGWVETLATVTGTDFNVYRDSLLSYSSRPELFTLGVLDRRMPGDAFAAVMLEGGRFHMGMERIGTIEYAVGYRPILLDGDRVAGVVAVPTLFRQERIEAETARQNAVLFGIVAFVVLTMIGIASFFANRIAAPIRRLTEATAHVAAGNLDVTVAGAERPGRLAGDEVEMLVQSFDSMTRELKRGRADLIRAEREMAWREMARQVAHEIKNPLTPMKLSIQHLRQTYRDRAPDFDRIVEEVTRTVGEQIDALSRIASEFSRYARMPERKLARCTMNEVLGEAVRLFEREEGVHFETSLAPDLPDVLADREELRRAFINVIRNSVQAMEGRGTIDVETSFFEGRVAALLRDSGPGIPEDVMPKLFTPNFSTKTDGMGLGLAMVKRMLDDIGGTIAIASERGKGVTVTITLPPAQEEARA
jgi:signal transduction histidine kinase